MFAIQPHSLLMVLMRTSKRKDYRTEKLIIDKNSRIKIHLASGGGFAMKLELYPVRGEVTSIPERKNIPSFYKKYIETEGLYVTSSEKVSDEALLKAW